MMMGRTAFVARHRRDNTLSPCGPPRIRLDAGREPASRKRTRECSSHMERSLAAPSAALLGLLYQSAFDECVLPAALEAISAATSTHLAAVYKRDMRRPSASMVFLNEGDGEERSRLYHPYADRDILYQAAEPLHRVGSVVLPSRLVPERELVRSDYYQGFCKPLDVHHSLSATLMQNADNHVELSLVRQRSAAFEERDVAWVRALMPHLLCMTDLAVKTWHLRLCHMGALEALNRQNFGVQLFDHQSRPVFCNNFLERMVESSALFHWRHGSLDASLPEVSSWLSPPLNPLNWRRRTKTAPYLCVHHAAERYHLMLAPFDIAAGFSSGSSVALIVSDLNYVPRSLACQLRSLYQLTLRESEVVMLLVQGASAREISETLRIAESTVVTHRKSVYQKLAVNNQSALVRIVLNMTS